MNYEAKKIIRTIFQYALIIVAIIWLVKLFTDHYTPPVIDRTKWTGRDGFVALAYEGIAYFDNEHVVSRAELAEQLSALFNAGYQTITNADLVRFYTENAPLPEKALYLIFKGGRRDNFIFGTPELCKYAYHATLFVPSKVFGERGNFFLQDDDLAVVRAHGLWEIGGENNLLADDPLEKIAGKNLPRLFDAATAPTAKNLSEHAPLAFIHEDNAHNHAEASLAQLSYWQVPAGFSGADLLATLANDPENGAINLGRGAWIIERGKMDFAAASMRLSTDEQDDALALLRGSRTLRDVEIRGMIDHAMTSKHTLFLRYRDAQQFVAIDFNRQKITVRARMIGEKIITLAEKLSLPFGNRADNTPRHLIITLRGDKLLITVNDAELLLVTLPPEITTGMLAWWTEKNLAVNDDGVAEIKQPQISGLREKWARLAFNKNALQKTLYLAPKINLPQSNTALVVALPNAPTANFANEILSPAFAAFANGVAIFAELPRDDFTLEKLTTALRDLPENFRQQFWHGVVFCPDEKNAVDYFAEHSPLIAAINSAKKNNLQVGLRLSLQQIVKLAHAKQKVAADYFLVDEAIPETIKPLLFNRYNRKIFLLLTP